MAANWFVKSTASDLGPFQPRQLKALVEAGRVLPETMVRRDDGKWFRADQVSGLFPGDSHSSRTSAGSSDKQFAITDRSSVAKPAEKVTSPRPSTAVPPRTLPRITDDNPDVTVGVPETKRQRLVSTHLVLAIVIFVALGVISPIVYVTTMRTQSKASREAFVPLQKALLGIQAAAGRGFSERGDAKTVENCRVELESAALLSISEQDKAALQICNELYTLICALGLIESSADRFAATFNGDDDASGMLAWAKSSKQRFKTGDRTTDAILAGQESVRELQRMLELEKSRKIWGLLKSKGMSPILAPITPVAIPQDSIDLIAAQPLGPVTAAELSEADGFAQLPWFQYQLVKDEFARRIDTKHHELAVLLK